MNFKEYQTSVDEAAFYPDARTGSLQAILFGVIGLNGEAGEVAEKVKKIWRDKDGKISPVDRLEIVKELGDVLFYLTRISSELGTDLENLAEINVRKFTDRRMYGTLQGSGDNR